jgi:hypothetical protein
MGDLVVIVVLEREVKFGVVEGSGPLGSCTLCCTEQQRLSWFVNEY